MVTGVVPVVHDAGDRRGSAFERRRADDAAFDVEPLELGRPLAGEPPRELLLVLCEEVEGVSR